METTFGYQYVDFDPDQIKKIEGEIDLEKAVNLFQSFPWDEQFAKAYSREEMGLTSLAPVIYFYRSASHFVAIYAKDDDGFMIRYAKGNNCGDLFVSNNIFEKTEGLTVEGILESFYKNKLESLINTYPKEKEVTGGRHSFQIRYSRNRVFRPVLFLLLPVILLFHQPFEPDVFIISFGFAEAVILVLILPTLFLNYRYWKNDSEQTVVIDSVQKTIEIKRGTSLTTFLKSDIIACDFVHVRISQRAWNEHSYLRLKTADKTFIITHFTLEPVEMLNYLQIHFKDVEVFYPGLDYEVMSEKEKERIQKNFEKKKQEFVARYSDYESDKLIEIINAPEKYADYAIAAAQEIMSKRQYTAVKNKE